MQATGNTITLCPAIHTALQQAARRRGIKPDAYVEELLTQTLTTEFQMGDDPPLRLTRRSTRCAMNGTTNR